MDRECCVRVAGGVPTTVLAATPPLLQLAARAASLPSPAHLSQVIDPPGSQYMMLVMEYMEKGPVLATRGQSGFGCMTEPAAANYFRQARQRVGSGEEAAAGGGGWAA